MSVAPILFVVFNRPDTTEQVFQAIREARPARLYVAADGPRSNKAGEAERCERVRAITTAVDWPCELKTLFRSENLGCGPGVSSAITWFFEHEPEGIILEDDCMPTPDFFRFCTEMLERYRHDSRVWTVSGSNLLEGVDIDTPYSYFFSNHDYIWGWATWRRAWQHYDYKMSSYPDVISRGYFNKGYHNSVYEAQYMDVVYDRAYFENKTLTWWDYQWMYARRVNSGNVVVPVKNLIVNLGLGNFSSNTHDAQGLGNHLRHEPLEFPLKHPPYMMIDQLTDHRVFKRYFTSVLSRTKSKIKESVPVAALLKPAYKAATAKVTQLFEPG